VTPWENRNADIAKPLKGLGSGVFEIARPYRGNEGNAWMKTEKIELVRGSGNVFRDLGHASPDVAQMKALFAAEIIKMLDKKALSVRAAHAQTGIAAADFSRIRNADLSRFTLDRLVSIINRLGSRVEVRVNIRTAASSAARTRLLVAS
jgi:predicted XRE-type DNA-binding protein